MGTGTSSLPAILDRTPTQVNAKALLRLPRVLYGGKFIRRRWYNPKGQVARRTPGGTRMKKTFRGKLVGRGPGGAWTSLMIPFSEEKVFGTKARLAVRGTVNGVP